MSTKLYWIEGPWPGKLAISARPRGGDWLDDEMAGWKKSGVGAVLSLLTPDEEESLDLTKESQMAKACGVDFFSLPIADRQVPVSQTEVIAALEKVNLQLSSGRNVVVHCRQGVGRSGLVAASLLITKGWDASRAIEQVSAVRGVPVPETDEQRRWIDYFAATLAPAK
jgi:protein-tyrosine phosphatase